jgi:DNA ligase D-like protein (predicted 3'-phosphoesterase)
MSLSEFQRRVRCGRKRRKSGPSGEGSSFVIQHHAARSDHYDLCLEIDGVLVSWAIPKGPSTNPKDRRMARRTEDQREDGADDVIVWDRGTYSNATRYEMGEGLKRGHISFRLHGEELQGGFALTRIREGKDETWLLIKRKDEDADALRKPVDGQPEPALFGQAGDDMDEYS